ncbi:MAG TPA: ABC transporter permease [Burkholderiales bacterium]|nr:ABC transporter permease [Burkholderiales bacterium]
MPGWIHACEADVVPVAIAVPDAAFGPTPARKLLRRIGAHRGLIIGAVILAAMVAMALLAPVMAPYDPNHQDLLHRLTPPIWHAKGTWAHPLGTDQFGRDYLSRILFGAHISLMIGFIAAIISGLIGTTLGVAAGYFGGKIDAAVTLLLTIRLSMPVVLVALAVVGLTGGSLSVVIMVLGFLLWDRFLVVTRSATMQIRKTGYVTAARAVGCSTARIVLSEILPNIINPLVVVITLEMAHAVILEASLSFLGMGVQPPTPEWGLMIAESKNYLLFDPWLIGIPGTALFLLVMSINLLGDGIRDVTAPEARN